jgi:hypothetical protein
MTDGDLAAVVAALTAVERKLIEVATPLRWPPLRGLTAGEILAELRRQGRYAAELAELGGYPDLAADPAAPWAALALLRTRPVVPAGSVRELLARVRSAPADGSGGPPGPGVGEGLVGVPGPRVREGSVAVGGSDRDREDRGGGEGGDDGG